MKKKSFITIFLFAITAIALIMSCRKNEISPTDTALYEEIMDTSNFVYSTLTPTIVKGLANSPRGWERIRFNKIAFSALDNNGRLPRGSVFPDGSIIVKEAYTSFNGSLYQYAVMKKDKNNKFEKKGWLWSEIETNGFASYAVSMKGKKCINCHTRPDDIDATRTFVLR
jgi:hypothetical protein